MTQPTPKTSPSPRELDVLILAGEGFAAKQIATELGLTIDTVKSFTRQIREKFGVGTTNAAVRYAVQHGYMPCPNGCEHTPVAVDSQA